MANDARVERQLMRLRGAGTRDVETTDFGFAVDAGSREERQLMRQRGAGSRQINNIDFGFAFATPSTVKRRRSQTPSRTPATATRKPAHSRTTPTPPTHGVIQQNVSSARSVRSRQIPDALRNESSGQPQRKRRRLSEISNMTGPMSVGRPLGWVSNTAIEEEDEAQQGSEVAILGEVDHIIGSDNQEGHGPVPTSPLSFPDSTVTMTNSADKENEHSGLSAAKGATKKRKRKSIGQQSLFKKKRNSSSLRPHLPTPTETQEVSVSVEEPRHNNQSASRERRWSIASSEPPPGPSPSSSPAKQITQQPEAATRERLGLASSKRRRKRKSVVQGKTKRRSSATVASTPSQLAGSVERGDKAEQNEEQEGEEEDEPNELPLDFDTGIPSEHEPENEQLRLGRRAAKTSTSSRRFTSEEPEQINLGDDEDADDTFLPAETTPNLTPALKRAKQKRRQQHKTTRTRAPNSAAATRLTGVQKRSHKSGFPILTHRMTNLHALPTITEVPEEDHQLDSDADELALPTTQAITTRTTPNAVDVLAQVCREAIDSSISAVKTQSLPRADLTRRLAALEAFRSTLDTRLFDLSQSLDQRLTMEARLRKMRREKAELQNRWLEIRRQRDQLDLRKDAVRRRHWEGEVLSRRKFEASQAAFAVEGAADQECGEGDGLELRLRQVANDVSSVDGGGMLQTLKGFNAQLERLAGALG
ncbi:hypothetical protein LTR70_000715 [Exophiala xenobiotica]|uniref:Inner kinetochore subunit AME1 domain-containing protein n=1 Tax=Lithohypha guttulata TaxID=1690604 RepID=A0ABR0KNC8_9EURO|nr:hypothetical protein LTR24_000614 [Lithohypha guttulata]KAK5329218.1 hypothetical protein LTR70_000715 [Exophiala xenobiotica]